ncbi:MAG: putative ATP-dependent helicase [Clostridiaceae bacterium]|jgi:superfamily II DNA/RNA helicase|nr:putative ATP-dependent helicase [Clostridiaceae bacterium]
MNDMSFKDFELSYEMLKALEKLSYIQPSPVQRSVIPLVLKDKDIIVKAETGSGKTAAFAIPVCEKIQLEEKKPQVLVLTPTRELAVQIKEDFTNIGRFKRLRCEAIFGKQPISKQITDLKQRVHIIAGTPGRTFDHIERGTIDLEKIKYLIIDEADEMLNMGFIDQVEAIIKLVPKNRVTMLFSATISDEIEVLCQNYMNAPEKIEVEPSKPSTEKIKQMYYEVEDSKKFKLLNDIIYTQRPDSLIIFCSTKERVGNVSKDLISKGYSCRALHGGMEQKDRLDTINKFKAGEFSFLVATDIAARGLDIEGITHIINYDVPMEKQSYVHRIGRTGRAGSEGTAITFVTPYEHRFLNDIEEYVQYRIPREEKPAVEEVLEGKALFNKKADNKPKLKKNKDVNLNKEITKIYINAGKKKKVRAGDIVGAITSIEGINGDDIGIIDIQDGFSYIDILKNKGNIVIDGLRKSAIKGKKVKVQKAEK